MKLLNLLTDHIATQVCLRPHSSSYHIVSTIDINEELYAEIKEAAHFLRNHNKFSKLKFSMPYTYTVYLVDNETEDEINKIMNDIGEYIFSFDLNNPPDILKEVMEKVLTFPKKIEEQSHFSVSKISDNDLYLNFGDRYINLTSFLEGKNSNVSK